jgi:putative hydrolase of the HAD superfamily
MDSAVAARAASAVRDVYTAPVQWSVYADTRDSLSRVSDAGFVNVVLSNHVPELPELIVDLQLDELIDDVITYASIGVEKPNRRAFELALLRAGSPATVWMVGDSPTADIAGAEAVGIPALLVRTPDPAGAVRTLEQAADIIVAGDPMDRGSRREHDV